MSGEWAKTSESRRDGNVPIIRGSGLGLGLGLTDPGLSTYNRCDDSTTNPEVAYVRIPTHSASFSTRTYFTSTHAWLSHVYLIHFSQLAGGLLLSSHVHIAPLATRGSLLPIRGCLPSYLGQDISYEQFTRQLKTLVFGITAHHVCLLTFNWEILTYLLTYQLGTYIRCVCLPRRRSLIQLRLDTFKRLPEV